MKKILLIVGLMFFALGTWAHQYEATVNGVTWYYNRISDGKGGYNAEITYRVSCYDSYDNEYSGSLMIPSTLGGHKVTSIGEYAFLCCSSLTSVTIPDSVTEIGGYAFSGCSALTSVTIGNSVTTIDGSAFSGCSSLTSVTIGNKVTSIGEHAFVGCSSLTSVTIPDSVTTIGSSAFSGCSSLTSVTIPNSVTTIGDVAFSGCSSLTSVTIGNSVTSIGYCAFNGCSSLKELKGWRAISGMPTNIESIEIAEGVSTIEAYAFCNCMWLTSITIPNSVYTIGEFAFCECMSLTSITIPNSVYSIGEFAFYECMSLTSVTIPDSVISIGAVAFEGCTSLTTVYTTSGNSARLKEMMRKAGAYVDRFKIVETPSVKGDSAAVITHNAKGYVVKLSDNAANVVITIPNCISTDKVTVCVGIPAKSVTKLPRCEIEGRSTPVKWRDINGKLYDPEVLVFNPNEKTTRILELHAE